MKYSFKTFYWGVENHTSVRFMPMRSVSKDLTPTACMVFAVDREKLLIAKSKRGWGLPGGHIELNESLESCAKREVREEADVDIDDLSLAGAWVTNKLADTKDNSNYPSRGAMLLYTANIKRVDDFLAEFETIERKFIKFEDIRKYHDGRSDFYEVSRYVINEVLK